MKRSSTRRPGGTHPDPSQGTNRPRRAEPARDTRGAEPARRDRLALRGKGGPARATPADDANNQGSHRLQQWSPRHRPVSTPSGGCRKHQQCSGRSSWLWAPRVRPMRYRGSSSRQNEGGFGTGHGSLCGRNSCRVRGMPVFGSGLLAATATGAGTGATIFRATRRWGRLRGPKRRPSWLAMYNCISNRKTGCL